MKKRGPVLLCAVLLLAGSLTACGAPPEQHKMVSHRSGKTEVVNYQSTVVSPFGPQRGRLIAYAKCGGPEVKGYDDYHRCDLGMWGGAGSLLGWGGSSWTLHPPAAGEKLNNGLKCDGRVLFSVLWGTLIHVSWDVYETNTGRFLTHTDFHHIDAELTGGVERVRGYTPKYSETKVNGKYVIYVEAGLAGHTTSSQWSDRTELTNSLREHPELILEGRN